MPSLFHHHSPGIFGGENHHKNSSRKKNDATKMLLPLRNFLFAFFSHFYSVNFRIDIFIGHEIAAQIKQKLPISQFRVVFNPFLIIGNALIMFRFRSLMRL